MARREELESRVKAASERFERIKREWEQRQRELEEKKKQIEAEFVKLEENRRELTQRIESGILEFYQRLKLQKGQAVVKVERGRCQGCHITLPTSQWQKARAGELVQCNSCNRILYVE